MSQWRQEDVDRIRKQHGVMMPANVPKPQKSKYRNVRTIVDGEKFDSQREALHWSELKLRDKSGEIASLQRQVKFDLTCPLAGSIDGAIGVVACYVADFVFVELSTGLMRVQDIKGQKETALFKLKAKWLFLQSGIEIEVVR